MRSIQPSTMLGAVSNTRRLRILQLVWDRELSAGEIAEQVAVSFPAVSQHLGKLRAAGLVSVRKDGRHRYYRARRADMGTLAIYLESMWNQKLDTLKTLAEAKELGDEQ